MADHLNTILGLNEDQPFKPYCYHSPKADAVLIRFRGDADYSVRLNDHVTKLISIDTNELVGVRIKGFKSLTADLPNFVKFQHNKVWLTVYFLKSWQNAESLEEKKAIEEIAEAIEEADIPLDLEEAAC